MPKVYQIASRTERDEDGDVLYWSNKEGWTDVLSADTFTPHERSMYPHLPIGGQWVEFTVREPLLPDNTPWGEIQSVHEQGDGVVFVTTAGHGGYWLSRDRVAVVKQKFPGFEPFAGWPWFEEDCDAAVVALAFPELFADSSLRGAVLSVRQITTSDWQPVAKFLDETPEGAAILQTVAEFEKVNGHLWERGGMWSTRTRGVWGVHWHRVIDGTERRTAFMPYPEKQFYSTEELDQFPSVDPSPPKPERPAQPVAAQRESIPFNEAECGGAFDGFSVSSDADPGL